MDSRLRFHRVFGLTLESDVPFDNRLGEGGGPPADLVFSYGPPGAVVPDNAEAVPDNGTNLHLFRAPGREVLRVTDVADFHLWPDRIVAHPAAAEAGPLIEIHLLGTVLSYWLEQRGLVTLHASAVEIEGRAAVFSSTHGGGKTGLAAALLQAGHPLLSDDLLPIEEREGTFLGRPGYPQMRMWPDEATWFLGSHEHLPVVHPELSKRRVPVGPGGLGTFHGSPLPLACVYLLERGAEGETLDIRAVSPRRRSDPAPPPLVLAPSGRSRGPAAGPLSSPVQPGPAGSGQTAPLSLGFRPPLRSRRGGPARPGTLPGSFTHQAVGLIFKGDLR